MYNILVLSLSFHVLLINFQVQTMSLEEFEHCSNPEADLMYV